MKNRKLLLIVSIVLALTMSLGGTLAYLTDTDADVNVMTLGKVTIEQHEYERVLKDDGTYEMVTSAKYGEGYKLQPFTQNKPLLPATGEITGWGDKVPFDQLSDKAAGAQAVFAGLNNVQDKFVLVENTGTTDAYVRTLIALEYGSNTKDIIGISTGDFWTWNGVGIVEIDGNNYYLFEAIYKGSESRHQGGILPGGDYTYSSLNQIYLANEATNEDVENLDGNGNGTYDILVVSQAVQAMGFADAKTALDEAFGDVTTTSHPWMDGKEGDQEPDQLPIPVMVADAEELAAALEQGGTVMLTDDIEIPDGDQILMPAGSTATLDLNGKTITSPAKKYAIRAEGNLTITNGTIEGTFGALGTYGNAVVVVENTTLTSKGSPGTSNHAIYTYGNSSLTLENVTVHHEGNCEDGSVLYANGTSTVTINGGTFTWEGSAYTLAAAGTSTVIINEGTFQNNNFFTWGGTITDNRTTD